jgi:hypothetical protein
VGCHTFAEVPLRRRGSVPLLRRGYFLLLQSGHEHWSQPLPVHASPIMCASYPQPIPGSSDVDSAMHSKRELCLVACPRRSARRRFSAHVRRKRRRRGHRRAASSGASISSVEASCSHVRAASAPQSASTVPAELFSAGETAASSNCSVRAPRWPSRLASVRASSISRFVCGATPSEPPGRGGEGGRP